MSVPRATEGCGWQTPDGAAHKQALLSALVEMFGTDEVLICAHCENYACDISWVFQDGLTLLPGVVEIFSRCDGMNEGLYCGTQHCG